MTRLHRICITKQNNGNDDDDDDNDANDGDGGLAIGKKIENRQVDSLIWQPLVLDQLAVLQCIGL